MNPWLLEMIFSFLATISYGFLFQVPKKALLAGGVIGMIGWILFRYLFVTGMNEGGSTLIASFVVASLSGWLAIILRIPVTTMSIAGIIPLVPGALAYRTMLAFVGENYQDGLILWIRTMTVAGAIAAGMIVSISLFNLRRDWRARIARASSQDH